MSVRLPKTNLHTGIIDAALAIAEERENTTQRLAYAVLEKDFETAEKLAKELLPNVESYRAHSSKH
jgi:hypothetical protein